MQIIKDLTTTTKKETINQSLLLHKIHEEIESEGAYINEVKGKCDFLDGIEYCLAVIEKYIKMYDPQVNNGNDMLSAEEIDNLLQALAKAESEET